MRSPGPAETQRLVGLLGDALGREERLWKVPVFKNGRIVGTDISPFQHHDVILWLGDMCRLFQFCPETFALGVCVLNRLLATVKAQPKYLKCIALTSVILAAKVNEEDEVIGSVKDLVVQSGCSFSAAEILRMERSMLDKLQWDLYTATPVDFINIFHALLISGHPHLPTVGGAPLAPLAHPRPPHAAQKRPLLHAALWTRQVQHCMACHQLSQFKGSTLALAIITLELERLTPDWFSVFTDLLKKAQIQSAEFIHCKEMVDEYLTSLEFSLPANAVYIFDSASMTKLQDTRASSWSPASRLRHTGEGRRGGRGRGEDQGGGGGGGDADEFYDGFRRLYNETLAPPPPPPPEVAGGDGGPTLHPPRPKSASPCPPLYPLL